MSSCTSINRFHARRLGVALVCFAAYAAAVLLSGSLAMPGDAVPVLWPASGIALAALVLAGPGLWPAVALARFGVAAWAGMPLAMAAGIAAAAAAEAGAAAAVLRHAGFAPSLERVRDLLVLLGAAVLSALGAGALVAATLTVAGAPADPLQVALSWVIGDLSGMLVIAPAVLSWSVWPLDRRRTAEALLAIMLIAIPSWAVFVRGLPYPWIIMVPTLWCAFRLGQRCMSLGGAAMFLIASWAAVHTPDAVVNATHLRGLAALQPYLDVRAFVLLLLAAVLAERRRAGVARDRFAAIVEATTDFVAIADADGRVLYLNRAGRRLAGMGPDAPLDGVAARDLVPPREQATVDEAIAAAICDGVWSGESAIRNREGSEVPVSALVLAHRAADGRVEFLSTITRDIGERKRAELAQREEAEVAAALVSAAQELLSSLDTPVLLERLCEMTAALLGADVGYTLFRQTVDGAFVPVATHGVPDAYRERVALVRVSAGAVARAIRALDGDAGNARLDVVPTGDPPRPQLCLALHRGDEVVAAQVVERADGRAFGERERRIARGVASIASMALANAALVEELGRANRLKSEFLSTMSHELRTPLNVILGFAEMARDAAPPGADCVSCIERIERAGRQLLELIESTLEIGKLEAGREELRLEPVRLAGFWDALGRACGDLQRSDAVALEWLAGLPDVALVTDPRKLTVLLRNLVGNALKFTERGVVRVEAELHTERVVFRVTDTGIGIHPNDREKIFEMFRQADGSDSRRFDGTGLGLYIVRRFVGQLGGTVAVESRVGEGSVFTVTIPRLPDGPPVRHAA